MLYKIQRFRGKMEPLAHNLQKNVITFDFNKSQKQKIKFSSFFRLSIYLTLFLQTIYIYSAIYNFHQQEYNNKYYNLVSNTHTKEFYSALKYSDYSSMEKNIHNLMMFPSAVTSMNGSILFLEQINNKKIPLSTKKKLATTIIANSSYGINAEKLKIQEITDCKTLDISCQILSSMYEKDIKLNIDTQEKIIMKNNQTISQWLETN